MKYRDIHELSQGILVELMESIYIHEGGETAIQFKFNDCYKRIIDFIENNKYTLSVVKNAVG